MKSRLWNEYIAPTDSIVIMMKIKIFMIKLLPVSRTLLLCASDTH